MASRLHSKKNTKTKAKTEKKTQKQKKKHKNRNKTTTTKKNGTTKRVSHLRDDGDMLFGLTMSNYFFLLRGN